jgi:hypothetical protein
MNKTKQKAVQITDETWDLVKEVSEKSIPEITRPKWIEATILERAKKERARQIFRDHVRKNNIKYQPCSICGSEEDIQAHHEDYDKPIDVTYLCRLHHMQAHFEKKFPGMVKAETEVIVLRLPKTLVENVRKIAKENYRSFNEQINLMLLEWIKNVVPISEKMRSEGRRKV